MGQSFSLTHYTFCPNLYFINTRVIGTLRILQAHHRWLPLLGEDEGMRMMIC